VNGIPLGGGTIYVRLWTQIAGTWQYNDYSYTAAALGTKAAMISPVPASVLTGSSATFTWTAGTGASAYWLDVNNVCATCGGGIFARNEGLETGQAVTGLPVTGGTLFVRLWTQIAGTWQYTDYTYTAATLGSKAAITSPAPGATLPGSSATFAWSPGAGATAYWLDVGSAQGQGNIFGQNVGLTTTQPVNGIPAGGGTIYVRLWTLIAGLWQYNDYSYTAAALGTKAAMISPVPGSVLAGSSATFTWTAGGGASAYWLDVNNVCALSGQCFVIFRLS
jgi:serine protease